jgi:hypothetical protein
MAPCSWTPEESRVESYEHQDNANIRYQPFPESVSEDREIHNDYDGCHRHHVKHNSYLSTHFQLKTVRVSLPLADCSIIRSRNSVVSTQAYLSQLSATPPAPANELICRPTA